MHLLPIFSLSVGLTILVGILVLKIIVSRNTRYGCKRKGEQIGLRQTDIYSPNSHEKYSAKIIKKLKQQNLYL